MKNKLPCEVVKDLLPSYVEQLTSDVTNELVKEHVEDCVDCKGTLEAMNQQNMAYEKEQETAQEKEIDFLKKTRKRTRRIVIGGLVAAFLLFCVLMFADMFLIGDPIGSESVYCRAQVYGNVLKIESTMIDSARVPSDIVFVEEEPGIINVSYKAVLCSPWNNRGTMAAEYASKAEQIRQVKVNDRIIWAEGEDILALTSAVYATRNPYVGDMPANAVPMTVLDMPRYFGDFSHELQTAKEPYGWTFKLFEDIPGERVQTKETAMKSYAYVLLAVVGNLGEVTYTYTSDGKESKLTVTKEEASAFAGHDIKDCYEDIVLLQKLIQKTGLDDYAFQSAPAAAAISDEVPEEREICINIVNNAEDEIAFMSLSYGIDEDWIGQQAGGRADSEVLRRGESMSFMFYPQDFNLTVWEEGAEAMFEASVENGDGTSYKVENAFKVPVSGDAVYTYVLSGNAKDGYTIQQ